MRILSPNPYHVLACKLFTQNYTVINEFIEVFKELTPLKSFSSLINFLYSTVKQFLTFLDFFLYWIFIKLYTFPYQFYKKDWIHQLSLLIFTDYCFSRYEISSHYFHQVHLFLRAIWAIVGFILCWLFLPSGIFPGVNFAMFRVTSNNGIIQFAFPSTINFYHVYFSHCQFYFMLIISYHIQFFSATQLKQTQCQNDSVRTLSFACYYLINDYEMLFFSPMLMSWLSLKASL